MKYEKEFPLFKTKMPGVTQRFDLADPSARREYFEAKAGEQIKKLKEYFEHNTFIAYLLGKKNAGKGTYTKLLIDIFGADKIGHISIGDVVRATHKDMADEKKKEELLAYLHAHYRGYISVEDALAAFLGRDTKSLLPSEFILALVKREIDNMPRKPLFLDGFPRDLDQVSYSLYFRDLVNYRSDPDLFVAIDIPDSVIDERIKYRVVCPTCQTPRNLKLMATKEEGHDKASGEFYLKCDTPACSALGARMVGKEGDNLGIETIRDRLEMDGKLIDKVFTLHGIPKILLRNAVPVEAASETVDD